MGSVLIGIGIGVAGCGVAAIAWLAHVSKGLRF